MEGKRQVAKEKGEQLATEHTTKFMEVSATTGHNVEECFMALARDIKGQIDHLPFLVSIQLTIRLCKLIVN